MSIFNKIKYLFYFLVFIVILNFSFGINLIEFIFYISNSVYENFFINSDNITMTMNLVSQDNTVLISQLQDNTNLMPQDNTNLMSQNDTNNNNESDDEEESGGVHPATGFFIFTFNLVVAVGGTYIFIRELINLFK